MNTPFHAPLNMIGVTGTNGKTSVTQWIAQAMTALGRKCAVVGTLGNGFPGALTPSPNTTPGAGVLREFLPAALAEGAQACAMEVSSIGLHQRRVADIVFDVAVFTNFTRDHLDYHGDMAEYAAMKRKLFEMPGIRTAVVNLDDAFGRQLAADFADRMTIIGYTLAGKDAAGFVASAGATHPPVRLLCANQFTESGVGIAFTLDGIACHAPVIGRFNAANLLATIGALLASGLALPAIATVLPTLHSPPGRMQMVGGDVAQGAPRVPLLPLVIVDYAHTPDALENVLVTLRGTAQSRGGQLVCVFGCGGERDPGKRPQMGGIAERLADRVVVTSDNPRGEDPQAIIVAILAGMHTTTATIATTALVEIDRAAAIRQAIGTAAARDVILLAGKGHEPYQEIAGVRYPFSDLEQAAQALALRHAPATPTAPGEETKC